jgi:hypothetical protein
VKLLTEPRIRRSFVNCSTGEANPVTLPRDLDQLPGEEFELLGWRDARAPLRGYLVVPAGAAALNGRLVGAVVADTPAQVRSLLAHV